MNIEKINVPVHGNVRILTAKGLDEKEPKKLIDISGSINTPLEYLTKRHDEDSVNKKMSHIEFTYEGSMIVLVVNEDSHYSGNVIGLMIKTEVLKKLKINTGETWSCFDLADFFRLNRTVFADKSDCAKLVTQLNHFKATVDKETEMKKDNRANYDLIKRQVVESNLPDSFKICLPVFKGLGKSTIEVEIDITPSTLDCMLISPELADIEQTVCEEAIDKEIDAIMGLCPELPIIEI